VYCEVITVTEYKLGRVPFLAHLWVPLAYYPMSIEASFPESNAAGI
jgi:hypothetical protein